MIRILFVVLLIAFLFMTLRGDVDDEGDELLEDEILLLEDEVLLYYDEEEAGLLDEDEEDELG